MYIVSKEPFNEVKEIPKHIDMLGKAQHYLIMMDMLDVMIGTNDDYTFDSLVAEVMPKNSNEEDEEAVIGVVLDAFNEMGISPELVEDMLDESMSSEAMFDASKHVMDSMGTMSMDELAYNLHTDDDVVFDWLTLLDKSLVGTTRTSSNGTKMHGFAINVDGEEGVQFRPKNGKSPDGKKRGVSNTRTRYKVSKYKKVAIKATKRMKDKEAKKEKQSNVRADSFLPLADEALAVMTNSELAEYNVKLDSFINEQKEILATHVVVDSFNFLGADEVNALDDDAKSEYLVQLDSFINEVKDDSDDYEDYDNDEDDSEDYDYVEDGLGKKRRKRRKKRITKADCNTKQDLVTIKKEGKKKTVCRVKDEYKGKIKRGRSPLKGRKRSSADIAKQVLARERNDKG